MSDALLIDTFTRLRRRFQAVASRILHDDMEAEDALQDAFCRLWVRRDEIDTAEQAEALTATTVRHLSIDRLRRQQAANAVPLDETRDEHPDDGEAKEREAQFAIVRRLVESRLTEMQRHILYRKEYDGRSCEEIAQELEMQPAAVRMQLSRARKAIREAYRQEAETML